MLSDNQIISAGFQHAANALNTINAVVRPQSLADETYRQLLLQLDMGLWRTTEKLPTEKALAESFGVSRPILREALARLKADGRIESRQGAGAFVADRNKISAFRIADTRAPSSAGNTSALNADAADIAEREMLELRQIVESGAAELAAARRTPDEVAAIRDAVAAMDRAIAARVDGSDVDDAFHSAIATATHNAQLAKFVEFLGAQFSASRKVTWDHAGYSVGITELGQVDHHSILNAIESGDAGLAKELAHSHVQRAIDRVNIRLQERSNERKLALNLNES
jgi:GntR family transcriptional repressor for pyruvate dehydrogenase complex